MATDKRESIHQIVADVIAKAEGISSIKRESLSSILSSAINGDEIINHIALKAFLSKDRIGILAYILTNAKVIKLEIDPKETKAFTFYLKDMTGVNRTIPNQVDQDNMAAINFEFKDDSFGLHYPSSSKDLDVFFRKIEMQAQHFKSV